MKYYEGHDAAYRRLKAEGHVTWDRRDYDDCYLKPFLDRALKGLSFSVAKPRALEVGCGTGPASAFLAQHGFDVTGIDLSETALEIAQLQAKRLGLKITYLKQDWLTFSTDEKFDLVLDGHCLHCIVFDEDRRRALETTRALLHPGGYFAMETMSFRATMDFGPQFRLDTDGVLWVKVARDNSLGPVEKWGDWYLPNRRLLHAEQLVCELKSAGFRILESKTVREEDPRHSDLFQAICTTESRG
ncbi:MAG TPA: class I SAM-dependent methyltransferase [Planctomycetota bacterium]|nr:class I SAM-dependent methyltransferase [Planctomycetota bacterium]